VGRRREQRIAMALPVRVSGTDLHGNPFSQDAETIDISRRGGRVRWIACLRGPGDIIEVRFQKEKARFRVAWIGEAGSKREGQVGLEVVDDKYIWGTALPSPKPDDYILPEEVPTVEPQPLEPLKIVFEPAWTGEERRYASRHRCTGRVEVINPETGVTLAGSLSDISSGGCYVEMMTPVESGREVELRLATASLTLKARGVVRASHPTIGMGVQFTEMSAEDRQRLEQLVAQLAGEVSAEAVVAGEPQVIVPQEEAAAAASPMLSMEAFDSKVMLETLLELLQSKGVLTREEFLQALERASRITSRK